MTDSTANRSSLPTRKEIIDACAPLRGTNVLKYEVVGARPLFIKFGSELMGGAETQKYLYEQSVQNPSAPRLPAVYDAFKIGSFGCRQARYGGTVIRQGHRSRSLDFTLPASCRASVWSRRSRPAQHRVFADHIAPLEFDSVDAVQRYLNAALTRFTPKRAARPPPVDFSNEEVCFYHSDIRPSNFHYDPETQKVTIVDLQHVGMGPKSFASYPLHVPHHIDREFLQAIATRIDYQRTESINGMARASGYLVMCSNPTLGLDQSGYRRPKHSHHSKTIAATT